MHAPFCTVWAFGSRVTGNAKPMSDLDLVLIGAPAETELSVSVLQDMFSESSLPIKVDVVDWNRTEDGFRKIIEEQKVVLQEV